MASGPSLANKVQVLFGTALLLIVASTLATPWVLTERLVYQSQLEVSRQLAEAWLDSPTRIASGGGIPIQVVDVDAIDPAGVDFESEALRRLEGDPSMEELFQQVDDGANIVYRYARGLRGPTWNGIAVASGLDANSSDRDPEGKKTARTQTRQCQGARHRTQQTRTEARPSPCPSNSGRSPPATQSRGPTRGHRS